MRIFAPFILWFSLVLFSGLPALGQSSIKPALLIENAPWFESPRADLLPKGFFNRGDTCFVESTFVDSSNIAWFCIKKRPGDDEFEQHWINAKAVRFRAEINENKNAGSVILRPDEDRKRRLTILRDHADWPRRIQKAVREGTICLQMTEEQLMASWNEPVEKLKCFMVGVGEYESWVFKGLGGVGGRAGEGKVVLVGVGEGRVVGWSW